MLQLEVEAGLLHPGGLRLSGLSVGELAVLPDPPPWVLEPGAVGPGAAQDALPPTRLLSQAVRRARLLRLAQRGITAKRAAEAIGCSPGVAAEVYRDPAFRRAVLGKVDAMFAEVDAAYEQRQLTLHERITAKGDAAFDRLCMLLEKSANEQLVAKIAMDILDRCPEAAASAGASTLDAETLRAADESAAVMDAGNVIPMSKAAR